MRHNFAVIDLRTGGTWDEQLGFRRRAGLHADSV